MQPDLGPGDRPILIYALSGLGKSELCRRYPEQTVDTDDILNAVLGPEFDDIAPSQRRQAWRALARTEPWRQPDSVDFQRWARVRRALVAGILRALQDPRTRLVMTNMQLIPWPYAAYYGVVLGGYMAHWEQLNRTPGNRQEESWNNHLEGFHPLYRLKPGTFLAQRDEILTWLDRNSSRQNA